MEKVRNIFPIDVGCYIKKASERKVAFGVACGIWTEGIQRLLCAQTLSNQAYFDPVQLT
jgi:hypothetical protein